MITAKSFTKIDQHDNSVHWSGLEGKFRPLLKPSDCRICSVHEWVELGKSK